jgi:acyl-CoA synthetase (AMP-forming)/AMP-acid ligase II
MDQDKFQAWFAKIPARKSILLYDTCESGSLTGNTRGSDIDERLGALNRMARAGTGRTFLTATTDNAPALEGYRGHGVFTYALLDALVIIRGGTNISPAEVEQALVASHPAVEEAAVVGIPDAVLGQRVFGFVTLAKRTADTIVSEILHNVGTRLASYKVPERLELLDKLPRNALSKVDRNALQAMAVKADRASLESSPLEAQAAWSRPPSARFHL